MCALDVLLYPCGFFFLSELDRTRKGNLTLQMWVALADCINCVQYFRWENGMIGESRQRLS